MKNVPISIIDDMAHASLLMQSDDGDGGDHLDVGSQASESLMKALQIAAGIGRVDVVASRNVKQRGGDRSLMRIAYAARVVNVTHSADTRRHSAFTIEIDAVGGAGRSTQLTVTFGRERSQPLRQWVALQHNPTTLLTGQNTWPAQNVGYSVRRDKRFKAGWAFAVLFSVCRAADPTFRTPKGLLRAAFLGAAVVQNRQFALYVPIDAAVKEVALAVLYSAFAGMRVGRSQGRLQLVDLGRILGIEVNKFEKVDAEGQPRLQTVMLRTRSGSHEVASVVVYDKAAIVGSSGDGRLDNLMRVDVTLKPRGLELLLSESIRLAANNGVELELSRNAKGALVRSEANIAKAIGLIERHFAVTNRSEPLRGIHAWLIVGVLFERFHLNEIFSFSSDKWRSVESWMQEWAARDERYAGAFRQWQRGEPPYHSLKELLNRAGLSKDSASRRLQELSRLGYSGDIPPIYWREWRAFTLTWGATDAELQRFHERADAGKPVNRLLKRWRKRMRPGWRALERAFANIDTAATLPEAPIARLPDASDPASTRGEGRR